MSEDWRKDDHRRILTLELAKTLAEYGGVMGDMAELIEKQCYVAARSREEYLGHLASILLVGGRGAGGGADKHDKCDICIFLERVSKNEWTLLGDIDF